MSTPNWFFKTFSDTKLPFITRTAALILAIPVILLIVSRLVYPFDIGHLEAFTWMPATHLLEFKNPYSFAFAPPYSMTPYGIVYYALMAVGVKFFGLQLWFGRFLTIVGFAICIFAAAFIARKITGNKETFWAVCLASLAFFPAQTWVSIMRSDFIALAFSASALALAFGFEKHKTIKWSRFLLILLLCVATFFTKHTFTLSTGIVVLRFWQIGQRRKAVYLTAAFSALTLAGMFLLDKTSNGGYIWQHFTHASELPFETHFLSKVILPTLTAPTTLVFAIALLIFLYKVFRNIQLKIRAEIINFLSSPELLLLFYFFLSFTTALISSARIGSNANYFLESFFTAAIIVGLIFDNFKREKLSKTLAAMTILFCLGGIIQLARFGRGEYFRWESAAYYQEISDTAKKFAPPGSICFSIYDELIARNGCSFQFDDYSEYVSEWSPDLMPIFTREVQAGRFAVVIWQDDAFEQRFSNYRLVPMKEKVPDRFSPVFLYVRREDTTQ